MSKNGFTLLELMVALTIGSIVMTASYVFWINSLEYQKEVEVRSQELRDMLYIRRTMQTDLMALLPKNNDLPSISVNEDNELVLRCNGRVEWAKNFGPKISVRYRLPGNSSDTNFFRRPSSDTGEVMPVYDFRIEQGLKKFHFDFLGKEGWDDPEQVANGSIRAIRLFFSWEHIGDWHIIMPVQDIGKI